MTERTIFLAAIDISDPAERAAYIEQASGGDVTLRARVEQLLSHHNESSQFLEKPAGTGSSTVELTIVSHGADDDDDDDRNSAALSGKEELRKYLQPSTRPGWLGRLAHYEIEQILGRGAFGIVVKAFDEKLHRVVAIKLMNPDLASTSPPRKRFLREARTAAAVRNEHIVGIYAVEEEPLPYLVMEYVPGMTLQQRLDQNGPLELSEILRIGQQVASGLAAAHAANLIHRDIKPSNILLEVDIENRARISDFGLARAVDDASLTSSGLIAGTPMYMAPEQARGEVLDHRADLFSLGSVLYQMASGRPPFRASNTVAVLKRVCEDAPRPIHDVIPGTAEWLCAIIMRLLEKKPSDRFQTAKEVAELFARCQAELQLNGKVTCVPGSQIRENSETAPSTSSRPSLDQSAAQPTIAQPSAAGQGSSRQSETATLKRPSTVYGILLGVMMLVPILFAKQIGSYVNAWIWPAIPTLPETAVAGGLEFDGKDDFVSIEAVDWSYPQFTIEAFVTSARDSDNGTIVYLGSDGEKLEWMSLYDDHPADPGKRLSGAAIQGKTPFANTSAPLSAGVRQHRVLVFDGRYMHYYVNGIWQAKRFAEAHEGLMWKMKNLRIACDGSERRFFQGRIDQVRISRIARYNANFAPVTRLSSDDSTLVLYNFNEGTGEVLHDASGNGHDGKIVGARWGNSKAGDLTSQSESPATEISNLKSQIQNAPGWHGWPADAPAPAIAPFNTEQAKKHQEAWAAYLKVPVEHTNSIGMTFRLIPPGEFTMGAPQEDIDLMVAENDPANEVWEAVIRSQGPQHRVVLTQPFYLSVYEITQEQFQRVMGERNSATQTEKTPNTNEPQTSNHPVRTATWGDAIKLTTLLSQLEQLPASYLGADVNWIPQDGSGYRLPTEAQWEFAGRAGTTTRYWSGPGSDYLLVTDWVAANSKTETHAAGEKPANPFGLYDIHGNVEEWTESELVDDYRKYEQTAAIDPRRFTKPGATSLVVRGGSCRTWAQMACSSAFRLPGSFGNPAVESSVGGCRLVLSVDAVRTLSNNSSRTDTGVGTSANSTSTPVSSEWLDRVSILSPEEQVTEFTAEMKRRNPEWDGVVTPTIADGQVVGITFDSLNIKDLSPIVAFGSLRELKASSSQSNGELNDLSPLAHLKSLNTLFLGECEKIADLSPLQNLPLLELIISRSAVSDLTPITGKELQLLNANYCESLTDLSPLKGAPFQSYLGLEHSGVTDLTPIRDSLVGMLAYNADRVDANWETISNWPLREFQCFHPVSSETLNRLKEIKTLERIDGLPLEEYLKSAQKNPESN